MTDKTVDGARPMRAEDSFDVGRLSTWLRGLDAGLADLPEVTQFSGGASNLTYLLRFADRDLILRRPPAGHKSAGAHDVTREYRIQHALRPAFGYVPTTVGLCEDETVIGSPFYVMERLDGHIPRKEFPPDMDLSPPDTRQLCGRVVDLLAELHQVDPQAAGVQWLAKGTGYVQRQVRGWAERYRGVKTWNVGSFEGVIDWLARNQPADQGSCLIHNDFRLDNIVFDRTAPTEPVGLLDWELATIGDPLMDLGGALAYWIQADDPWSSRRFRTQPTHAPGMLTRAEVVDRYCTAMGFDLTDRQWCFYEVFGLFRLAVICQQIYYRYHHKQTTNEAFRLYFVVVRLLERRCRSLIRRYR